MLYYALSPPQASNILVESPSGQGCLYFLATFLSVQYFWVQKMNFDARFVVADDIYHRVFELFGLAVLASVVLHIRPVSILGNAAHSSDMFALALSLTVSWLYHIWRSLELIATGQGQRNVIRSMAWRDVRLAALPLAFCLASTILAGNDYFKYENKASGGDYRYLAAAADGIKANGDNITAIPGDTMYLNDNSSSSNLAIWLILFATIAHYSIFFLQVVFLFPNDGSHKNFGTFYFMFPSAANLCVSCNLFSLYCYLPGSCATQCRFFYSSIR